MLLFPFFLWNNSSLFYIKHASRCFSLSLFYAFDVFSLIVAKILWLIRELVYQPNSHSITNTIENRRARARSCTAHLTLVLSVLHRSQISALSVGKHWIDVRSQLGSVTDEFHQELSLIRAIITRKMKVMTLQRSGRAVWTQQIRSRDLGQLGGCSRSCDRRDRRKNVTALKNEIEIKINRKKLHLSCFYELFWLIHIYTHTYI